jgi:hypothetical protein
MSLYSLIFIFRFARSVCFCPPPPSVESNIFSAILWTLLSGYLSLRDFFSAKNRLSAD